MGRKRREQEPTPPPGDKGDAHKGVQINLRINSLATLKDVDNEAAGEERSRNSMLNVLIKEALAARKRRRAED